MNIKFNRALQQLTPFLVIGIVIAIAVALFIMVSYVLAWGLFLGAIIWAIAMVKQFFFSPTSPQSKEEGRIIEHDEQK